MSFPTQPSHGQPWDTWGAAVTAAATAVTDGRLSDPALGAAFGSRVGAPAKTSGAPKLTAIGDSITVPDVGANFWASGYLSWANASLRHRFDRVGPTPTTFAWATAGQRTDQSIAAGQHTAAAASAADVVVVHLGTNDVGFGTAVATIYANLRTIWTTLTAAGKTVVATTILPRSVDIADARVTGDLHALNHMIRTGVPTLPNVVLCDWAPLVMDPSTGGIAATYSADGLHPNSVGASVMGRVLGDRIESARLFPGIQTPYLPSAEVDPVTISPNPFMLGNNAGVANNVTAAAVGAPTSLVHSKVARTDGLPGEWQQFVVVAADPNADGVSYTKNATTKFAPGDVVVGVCEFETDPTGWNARHFALTVSALFSFAGTSDLSTPSGELSGMTASLRRLPSGVFVTPPLTVPADQQYVQLVADFKGSGTARLGRMAAVKIG